MTAVSEETERIFHIRILGRTLEHLGVQMYKRRDVAIAELVANCWDAGAKNVFIKIPDQASYDPLSSTITITDDGFGMEPEEIQKNYLVIGRNRREAGDQIEINDNPRIHEDKRLVMGRKGIGKLAGFGIAKKMTVITWRDGKATHFTLDLGKLKQNDGVSDNAEIRGTIENPSEDFTTSTGTHIILSDLKHKTAIKEEELLEALGRRFSRTVFGRMRILVNSTQVTEPNIYLPMRVPSNGYTSDTLDDGTKVKYYYGFAEKPIASAQLRGFTIHIREKTGQAPPFFFNVEGTASGQHGTRYLTGVIEADFLDVGKDDNSDLISTDRQELDWEDDRVQVFKQWGDALTRKALREWAERKGKNVEEAVLADPDLSKRISVLDITSQNQIKKFLAILGRTEADLEDTQTLELAGALVRAYEYKQFHDVIKDLEKVGDDPEQLQRILTHLADWKVMESRAILEIIKGRLEIIEKFHSMLVNNAPETASSVSKDNMHDLLAQYPWILNPEWQVLEEERTVSNHLKEWNAKDITNEDEKLRYDFLALNSEGKLVIIEIKRSGHPVTYEETSRLVNYREKLSKAHRNIHMVLIHGGTLDLSEAERENWSNRPDGDIYTWAEIFNKTRTYYDHYKAVLEGDINSRNFNTKEKEVIRTREVLNTGNLQRGKKLRAEGLGAQDVDYQISDSGTYTKNLNGHHE